MKTFPPSTQHGQALVLVVLAAVALFAFAALAIDGSAVFSDRRHAQNAADTSSLAAALAKIRGEAWPAVVNTAQTRSTSNGYNNNGTTNVVEVYLCSDVNATCTALPAGADKTEYIQVRITSHVKTTFARVIGRAEMTNHVNAVARATPAKVVPWYDGNALVSTMMTCKNAAGWPHDPFDVGGSSSTTVVSSGILVNANCPDSYEQGGSSDVTTDKGVCVMQSAQSTNTSPPPTTGCEQIDPNQYTLPAAPACPQNGTITEISSKNYVATPGQYPSNKSFPDASAGTLKLQKGIYCLPGGISLNGTWSITTDLNGNGLHDSGTEGVFFYVPTGSVTWNGNSYIDIHAISAPFAGFDSTYLNYLMYLPPTNTNTIKITGSEGSNFTGTILAPASHVILSGGSTSSGGTDDGIVTLDAQIISFTTAITGNGTLDILYTQSNNGATTTKPTLSQIE